SILLCPLILPAGPAGERELQCSIGSTVVESTLYAGYSVDPVSMVQYLNDKVALALWDSLQDKFFCLYLCTINKGKQNLGYFIPELSINQEQIQNLWEDPGITQYFQIELEDITQLAIETITGEYQENPDRGNKIIAGLVPHDQLQEYDLTHGTQISNTDSGFFEQYRKEKSQLEAEFALYEQYASGLKLKHVLFEKTRYEREVIKCHQRPDEIHYFVMSEFETDFNYAMPSFLPIKASTFKTGLIYTIGTTTDITAPFGTRNNNSPSALQLGTKEN
ncbi:hypothetical protein BpHYR1_052480, partial [Brachionus plicatilis]